MDNTRANGTGQAPADALDVGLAAVSQWDELANDMLAQTEIRTGDHLELYILERRAMLRLAYAQAYQAAVTNRLLGHLVHAVNGLAVALGEEEAEA